MEYLGSGNANFQTPGVNETNVGSGLVYVSTDSNGMNWTFGGQLQYILPSISLPAIGSISPTPDPFNGACTGNSGFSSIQTTITEPNSLPANFAIGPSGFFVEDRYQSDQMAFIGAAMPASPIDLSGLSGAAFLGVNMSGGEGTANQANLSAPQLVSASAAADGSGKSIRLVGGAFPSNDPTQTSVNTFNITLGTQDSVNNGYFPSATYLFTGPNSAGQNDPAYAIVTQVGGKYTIFVLAETGSGIESGWILFQQ
uniref:Uncharacterized protein n=1 Tax=Paracidobacterium acidisoli TaxID=2303751 RepID=A0A372IS45_9BACT